MRDLRRLLVLIFVGYRAYRRMKRQTAAAARKKAAQMGGKAQKPATADAHTTPAE